MSGQDPERAIEPLQVYAHSPALLLAYGRLEQATAKMHHVGNRHRALAELKAATSAGCPFCTDLGSQIARRWGITDGELLALSNYRQSDLFDEVDRLVLDYAEAMTYTPARVSDELFEGLRRNFNDTQLLELTHIIALENMRGRFNLALDIGSAGFSEGQVCALLTPHGRTR
jgi:alkylhydroperoxidase family enzyme